MRFAIQVALTGAVGHAFSAGAAVTFFLGHASAAPEEYENLFYTMALIAGFLVVFGVIFSSWVGMVWFGGPKGSEAGENALVAPTYPLLCRRAHIDNNGNDLDGN